MSPGAADVERHAASELEALRAGEAGARPSMPTAVDRDGRGSQTRTERD